MSLEERLFHLEERIDIDCLLKHGSLQTLAECMEYLELSGLG